MRVNLLLLLLLWAPIAVICLAADEGEGEGEALLATFTLFDNGSSENGINVTLSASEFLKSEIEDEPGLAFAIEMSKLIEVSKFEAPKPVIATKAYREDGELITSHRQLLPLLPDGDDNNEESLRRVYLVADGLEFVWPFVSLHHMQEISPNVLPPVPGIDQPIIIESLSETPRVFHVHNLFTEDESNAIIESAHQASGVLALQRSTTGTGDDLKQDPTRTSHNAWDWQSPAARKIITRSFQLTTVEEDDGKRDGLQVVRYNKGEAYNYHPDYSTPDKDPNFEFEPYKGGSNRFATVFLYLNNVDSGGYTVFTEAPDIGPPRTPPPGALEMFEPTSWQHWLLNICYEKLAVPPKLGSAALFYSITPDGRIDHKSIHGACPVVEGTKWGANLWIWNKQRYGATRTGGIKRFLDIWNQRDETMYISYEGQPMTTIPGGQRSRMNTFEFHRFQAHLHSHEEKMAVDSYTVQSRPDSQVWTIKKPRVYNTRAQEGGDDGGGGAVNDEL
mmetsp:Transcript_23931/g.35018  ORF Transcript_23931/g.35018 Transcript_23931/m.35018 type:complete len:504 (+) Transcript_23931:382-1893(+)|eukprot:CAMPEP_0195525620 /NCGR_PEP_ID=MMETSP0794_2-20130614/26130_1 /TAXON_ID=515487 /ORGANISM="Stephanopyxis turris, Strain CCMP 815" /LENGTH=503 /DNA_ID=CAMNT_0040656111 /DNA_START=382 /DNA_END=1893 /DNA_ORIENTATION=+